MLTSWVFGDPCSNLWAGVQCANSSVVFLNVSSVGLRGTLPLQLSSLSHLTFLALSDGSLSGTVPPQLSALTSLAFFSLARQPCLYGPLVNVSGLSYATAGSSLGNWSVPVACNLTLPPAPPPPSLPPSPPPTFAAGATGSVVTYDPFVSLGASVSTVAGSLGNERTSSAAAVTVCTTSSSCVLGPVTSIIMSPDGTSVYFVDQILPSLTSNYAVAATYKFSSAVMGLALNNTVYGGTGTLGLGQHALS